MRLPEQLVFTLAVIITFINKTHNLRKARGKWLMDILNCRNAKYVHEGPHIMFTFCFELARCPLRTTIWFETRTGSPDSFTKSPFTCCCQILNTELFFWIFFSILLFFLTILLKTSLRYLVEMDRRPLRNAMSFIKTLPPPFRFPFSLSDVLPRPFQICSGEHLVGNSHNQMALGCYSLSGIVATPDGTVPKDDYRIIES